MANDIPDTLDGAMLWEFYFPLLDKIKRLERTVDEIEDRGETH